MTTYFYGNIKEEDKKNLKELVKANAINNMKLHPNACNICDASCDDGCDSCDVCDSYDRDTSSGSGSGPRSGSGS